MSDYDSMYRNNPYEEDARYRPVEVKQEEKKTGRNTYTMSVIVRDEVIANGMKYGDYLSKMKDKVLNALERKMAEEGYDDSMYTVEFRADQDAMRMATRITAIARISDKEKMYFGIDMANQPARTGYRDATAVALSVSAEDAEKVKAMALKAAEDYAKLIASLSEPDVIQRNVVLIALEV